MNSNDSPPAGPEPSASPRVVAVIPARGGSVGVPQKNLRPIAGRSLVTRAVDACTAARLIDQVLVSSDSSEILDEGRRAGARGIERPKELSGSTASSESAVLHALNVLESESGDVPEVVLLVQCTSPFMDSFDLDAAVSKVLAGEADVAFSVANNNAVLWKFGPAGGLVVVNVAENIQARMMSALVAAKEGSGDVPKIDVDAVVTDFDGVHTDDRLYLSQDGVESVQVSREDGMGVALARKAGIRMLILSTETNPVVTARAQKLEIRAVQGQADKAQALKEWIAEEGLDPGRVAYLGNDVNDLGCLRMVGWPVVVANAHPDVKAVARLELKRSGGAGAVRELCELVVATASEREEAVLAAEETERGR